MEVYIHLLLKVSQVLRCQVLRGRQENNKSQSQFILCNLYRLCILNDLRNRTRFVELSVLDPQVRRLAEQRRVAMQDRLDHSGEKFIDLFGCPTYVQVGIGDGGKIY